MKGKSAHKIPSFPPRNEHTMVRVTIRYAHKTLSGRYTSTRKVVIHYTNEMKSILKSGKPKRPMGIKVMLVFPLDRLKMRGVHMRIHMGTYVREEKEEPLNEQLLSMGIALLCLFSCHMWVTCVPT